MASLKVAFIMSDYGHDPTETAIPYRAFKSAGFSITFLTETGKSPICDSRMLQGISGALLGANKDAKIAYEEMLQDGSHKYPKTWSKGGSDQVDDLQKYNLVFLPGGHDKGVRQVIESPIVQKMLVDYWPHTLRSKTNLRTPTSRKTIAAICHGVLCLARAQDGNTGNSLLRDVQCTALPHTMEQSIYYATSPFLGDYYKTYGASSKSVQQEVEACMEKPRSQWRHSLSPSPYVMIHFIPKARSIDAFLFWKLKRLIILS